MRKLVLAMLLLSLAGCAGMISRAQGTHIDREKVLNIKPGTTTRSSVISDFGEPAEVSFENGEEKFRYVFKEKRIRTYMAGLVEDASSGRVITVTLELTLKDGIVYSYRYKTVED